MPIQSKSAIELGAKVRALLSEISAQRTESFTGAGIVFYSCLDELPHMQMACDGHAHIVLGDADSKRMATMLCEIADASSVWHDGFHFVHVDAWRITHTSQYLSPPIHRDDEKPIVGSGARYVAALLTSRVKGIVYVGLVSRDGSVQVFRNGQVFVEVGIG